MQKYLSWERSQVHPDDRNYMLELAEKYQAMYEDDDEKRRQYFETFPNHLIFTKNDRPPNRKTPPPTMSLNHQMENTIDIQMDGNLSFERINSLLKQYKHSEANDCKNNRMEEEMEIIGTVSNTKG